MSLATTTIRFGKIAPEFFESAIAPHLGMPRAEVLSGPRAGHDAAVVRIGAARVMAVTTDPLSLVPAWGVERSARLACHLIASDLWTTGIPPAYASVSFHLPAGMDDATFAAYWSAMADEWKKLEVAVVTGHTGRYAGLDSSIIGAATLVGIGDEVRHITPQMARPGDRVIVTKGCAVETTAVVAHLCPKRLAEKLGAEGVARAKDWVERVSVVPDCRAALKVGVRTRGVTSLHDATEGGVLGGLVELAKAAGADLRVERARIPLAPEARAACEVLGVDPWTTLSEGTLIATASPRSANDVLDALIAEGIEAAAVGEVASGSGAVWLTEPSGDVVKLTRSEPDPYWAAYQRAVDEGWE